MKKIVILPNPTKDKGLEVTRAIADKLALLGFAVYLSDNLNIEHPDVISYVEFPAEADLIVVVGGDGSVIDASRIAIDREIPIVGVNLGRVGYLSEIDPGNLDVFARLKVGDYSVKEKMLLTVSCPSAEAAAVYAVNDVIVSHGEYLGISEFSIEDSLGNSLAYRADGLIIATPQGSTAYSFSSGGPVLAHDVDGMLVTPVCPHSFFNRSVLFNSAETITVENTGDHKMNIAADGRLYATLLPGERCRVRAAEKKIKMLTFSENKMFTELFKKMNVTEGLK